MHIFDTATLTHLHKGNKKVKERLAKASGFEFGITNANQGLKIFLVGNKELASSQILILSKSTL